MKKCDDKGQSTIEFILTFTAAIGFIFLFLKMAENYTNGYMVHHATYMSSRAFLVVDTESQQSVEGRDKNAFEAAKKVFKKNLPEVLIPSFSGDLQANYPLSVPFAPFIGVWIEYSQPFSMGFVGGKEKVTFRSESFLGREPSRAESIAQTCTAIKTVTGSSCDIQSTLEDNGG